MDGRAYVTWPNGMGYDDLVLDYGQVFVPQGRKRDPQLTRLGYFESLANRGKCPTLHQCQGCGGEFVNDQALLDHGKKRHSAGREFRMDGHR